jgi:hypothetical protein
MSYEREWEGLEMLRAFESVGVQTFNLSRTDIDRQVVPEGYRPGRNINGMKLLLPAWMELAWKLGQNLIVRAQQPAHGTLVQLDDLVGGQLDRLQGSAFMTTETSPGSFQLWLLIKGGDQAFVKRLMRGSGSDSRANCSGRVAGSPNVKRKYAPNFPAVRLVAVQPGRKVESAELESAGLIAPPAVARAFVPSHFRESAVDRGWPDYERCLRGAPPRADGSPDRSRVDFLWSKWAIERGNGLDAVKAKLLEVSEKAKEEWARDNRDYVRRTVDAALAGACETIPQRETTQKWRKLSECKLRS